MNEIGGEVDWDAERCERDGIVMQLVYLTCGGSEANLEAHLGSEEGEGSGCDGKRGAKGFHGLRLCLSPERVADRESNEARVVLGAFTPATRPSLHASPSGVAADSDERRSSALRCDRARPSPRVIASMLTNHDHYRRRRRHQNHEQHGLYSLRRS